MFEIAAFSRHLDVEGKKAGILKLRSFSTELRRSYIDFTLEENPYFSCREALFDEFQAY